MPKHLKPDAIIPILESGNFETLIGIVEDECLEVKSEPYRLHRDHQKQELAKDVSGLANVKGGVILIGVQTKRDPIHFGDEINRVRPFEAGILNPNQYQDILRSWIYPALAQIDVRWFPTADNRERGIAAIIIPQQPSGKRPFLITKTVDDRGKRVELVFGYVERRRANVDPMSVQGLQSLIRDGLRFDAINQQIESIQNTIQQLRKELSGEELAPSALDIGESLRGRINQALTEAALNEKPAFILTAFPIQATELPTLFQSSDAEIVRLIESPPELRTTGFDLNTGARALIIRGQLRQAVSPAGRKILQLWRDGALIFAASGGRDFLCWGNYSQREATLRINPLTLIESTFLFVELSKKVFNEAEPRPVELEYRLELRNMPAGDSACGLIPGPLGSLVWQFGNNIQPFPDPETVVVVKSEGAYVDPGAVAFALLREMYLWFGIESEQVPYAAQVDDRFVISPDQIREAGKGH